MYNTPPETKQTTAERVIEIINGFEYGYPDPITPASQLEHDLGLDSLDVQEVIMECENHYGVSVPDPLVREAKLKTVDDIANLIDEVIADFPKGGVE